jgi:A/G-specific adenine glycosylase
MAQQTRLESMLPYYKRWMRAFPTVKALASADEQDVLALWEGLGYYTRARNLRKGAQVVMAEHGGRVPSDWDALSRLPGVGPYTAGAIGSVAFGLNKPAVDGNAMRVLSRVFNVSKPMDSASGKQALWELAAAHLPSGRAAEYNQALMDLGAGVCTPRVPKCATCPVASVCEARALGIQEQRPVKAKAKAVPVREFAAAVIWQAGEVLVLRRPDGGLLAGMWEFPNAQIAKGAGKAKLVRSLHEKGLKVVLQKQPGVYEHAYSHFEARLHVYEAKLNGKRPAVKSEQSVNWVKPRALARLPMGKLDRRVANSLLQDAD